MLSDPPAPARSAGVAVDLDALSDGCAVDRFLRCSAALRARGMAIIAMTDRRRCDLIQAFPGIRSEVDALIYEHGCVAEVGGRLYPLAKPVPQFVGTALRRSGVPEVSGQVSILVPPRGAATARALFADTAEVDVEVAAGPLGAVIVPRSVSPSAAFAFVAAELKVPANGIVQAHSAMALLEALSDAQIAGVRGIR